MLTMDDRLAQVPDFARFYTVDELYGRAREAARALARGLRREMGWYRYLGAAAAARLAPEAVPEGSHPPGDAAQRPIPRS